MAAEKTSFVQFDYCKLCKTSHKKQKKHIYSKRHQEILQNILKKFSKKVKDARSCLGNPTVEALGWENGSKFWCYYCETEVDRHRRETDATVKYGGLVAHIASDGHVKKTGEFFWKNIIDKNKKKDQIMSRVEAERFYNKSETALTLYRQKMNKRIQQMTEKIHTQTIKQQFAEKSAVKAPPWEQMCTKQTQVSQQAAAGHVTSGPSLIGQSSGTRFKTVEAVAVGLTAIVRPKPKAGEKEVGNVFTGGTPPWLRESEEEDEGGGDIGPSMSQYEKHLDRERKKKLPANRVGANMDRSLQTSESWLPSFGGVWNKGRRLNSKVQFERRSGMKSSDHSSTASTSTMPIEPTTVVPYIRRKKTTSSTTGSSLSLISSPLVDERPAQMQSHVHPGLISTPLIHSPLIQSTPSIMDSRDSFEASRKRSLHQEESSPLTHTPLIQSTPSLIVPQESLDASRVPKSRSLDQNEFPQQSNVVKSFKHSTDGQALVSSSGVPHNQTQTRPQQIQLKEEPRVNKSMQNEFVNKETTSKASLLNSIAAIFPTSPTKRTVVDLFSDEKNGDHKNLTKTQSINDNVNETGNTVKNSSVTKPDSYKRFDSHDSDSVETKNTTESSNITDQSLDNGVSSSKRTNATKPVSVVPYKRKKTKDISTNQGSSIVEPFKIVERPKTPTSVDNRNGPRTTFQRADSGQSHATQPAYPRNIPQIQNHVRLNQGLTVQGRPQFSGHQPPHPSFGQITNQSFVHHHNHPYHHQQQPQQQQQQQQQQNSYHGHQNQQGMQYLPQEHWSGAVPPRQQQFSPFTQNISTTPQQSPTFAQAGPARHPQFSPFVQNPAPSVYGQVHYGQNLYTPQPATAYQAAQSTFSQTPHMQGAPQAQTQPSSGGGLNLFNSISAAVGSKLPKT